MLRLAARRSEPQVAPHTRRSFIASLSLAAAATACAAPWSQPAERLRVVSLPSPTPVRYATPVLRVVLPSEGIAALDGAVAQVVDEATQRIGARLETQSLDAFAAGDSVAHRLLVAVQAGVPPDALLLMGRQAQTARFHAMELTQDVSALLRPQWRRFGPNPKVTELWCAVAGSWHGAPYYQRLVGHWVRPALLRQAGQAGVDLAASTGETDDPSTAGPTYAQLAQLIQAPASQSAAGALGMALGFWSWGIGAADTPDADAWVWTVINAWGGGLADLKGERINLDTPETAAALEWLAMAIREGVRSGRVPPQHGAWTDADKNAALLRGMSAYSYTERLLDRASVAGGPASAGSVAYLPGPRGPVSRPHVAGPGAVWYVPRGAQSGLALPVIEQVLAPEQQARVWAAAPGQALPAFQQGWDDPSLHAALTQAAAPPGAALDARRFRQELDAGGGFYSATGNGGPETPPSQALSDEHLGAAMLRQVVAGRPARDVTAEAAAAAAAVYRAYGFPG